MVQTIPRTLTTVTGKTRVRMGYFRRVITQVQIRCDVHHGIPVRPGSPLNILRTFYEWRDATAADMPYLFQGVGDETAK